MRSSPWVTVPRRCIRPVSCWPAFPSAPALGSTGSAADRSAAFVGFAAVGASVVRYAFTAEDFHLILLAGLPAHSLEGRTTLQLHGRTASFEALVSLGHLRMTAWGAPNRRARATSAAPREPALSVASISEDDAGSAKPFNAFVGRGCAKPALKSTIERR
jgi:hypothetical protein